MSDSTSPSASQQRIPQLVSVTDASVEQPVPARQLSSRQIHQLRRSTPGVKKHSKHQLRATNSLAAKLDTNLDLEYQDASQDTLAESQKDLPPHDRLSIQDHGHFTARLTRSFDSTTTPRPQTFVTDGSVYHVEALERTNHDLLVSLQHEMNEKDDLLEQTRVLKQQLEATVSQKTILGRSSRTWMIRGIRAQSDYHNDVEISHHSRNQFGAMENAVNVARREATAAQQESIALSHELREYYYIIKDILKDPSAIDADNIHDRIAKYMLMTKKAQADRNKVVADRVRFASQYETVVVDTDAVLTDDSLFSENIARQDRMKQLSYTPDPDIEADIPSLLGSTSTAPLRMLRNTPWKEVATPSRELDKPIPTEDAERVMQYGEIESDFTRKEHQAFKRAWKKYSKELWGVRSRWGDIADAVGNGRTAAECIRHYRATGPEEKWEEQSRIGRERKEDEEPGWERDVYDRC